MPRSAARALTDVPLTQAALARLLGIAERSLRQYMTNSGHISSRPMPEPVRRLIQLINDDPSTMIPKLEQIAKENS